MVLIEPIHYSKLQHFLKDIPFNHLFAQAVIDGAVAGRVYANSATHPTTIYVVHRYGMSLLCGKADDIAFNEAFKKYALNIERQRNEHEWMQVYPAHWKEVLSSMFGDLLIHSNDNIEKITHGVVELNTRVNFRFHPDKFNSRKKTFVTSEAWRIVDTTHVAFHEMNGSVVPSSFWNTPQDFIKNGVAFGLYVNEPLAAVAFSSFLAPQKLEIGIETKPEFRGRGCAEAVCAAIIDYCIEKGLEPIWACRLENTGSYVLAQKLGFEPLLELPYYRLSN